MASGTRYMVIDLANVFFYILIKKIASGTVCIYIEWIIIHIYSFSQSYVNSTFSIRI